MSQADWDFTCAHNTNYVDAKYSMYKGNHGLQVDGLISCMRSRLYSQHVLLGETAVKSCSQDAGCHFAHSRVLTDFKIAGKAVRYLGKHVSHAQILWAVEWGMCKLINSLCLPCFRDLRGIQKKARHECNVKQRSNLPAHDRCWYITANTHKAKHKSQSTQLQAQLRADISSWQLMQKLVQAQYVHARQCQKATACSSIRLQSCAFNARHSQLT